MKNPQKLNCDVLVAGGGISGVAAALAAARRGAKVILCQDRPVLGGNASSEVRMHVVGADMSGKRGKLLETEAREGGIIEEIRLENCVQNAQRSPSVFDLILYDKCRNEPNLTLMLNTLVTSANVEGGRIVSVGAERPSTEDCFAIDAKVFIDATGDGRLGVESGAPFMEGRESREQFGESLAQLVSDNQRLGSSIMFQARKHDRLMSFHAPSWARKFTEADLRLRPHASTAGHGDLGLEYGYWWIEWGGHLDTLKQNELIRDELLAIVLGAWDHVKNGGNHGAENWALEWFGFLPGKRESRRFVGQYVITQNDVQNSTPFDDAIAYGGWFIDTHPPLGVDATEEPPCTQHDVKHLYDIPLRCCVSKTIGNLMFAGRNISATHIAFASTRVMATCAVVGQGVGTAAAFAAIHRLSPSALAENRDAMRTIQQQLLEDDAFLIGQANEDPLDLTRRATITASSEQPGGEAANVVTGITRCVHGTGGVCTERVVPGLHRWMSDPHAPLPAWIQFEWPEPITPARLQLIFDTGLHRVMTFSLADTYVRQMQWGVPCAESVRDYQVEALYDGVWRSISDVQGNYQRRNIILLDGKPLTALRIVVTATNGLDHARICEVRVQ
jgi:hypothetical protein